MNYCENLHPFFNGELSDIEHKRFELHLNECATCNEDVKLWHTTKDLWQQEELIPGAHPNNGVRKQFENISAIHRQQRTVKRVWVIAAAATFLVGLGLLLYLNVLSSMNDNEQVKRFAHSPQKFVKVKNASKKKHSVPMPTKVVAGQTAGLQFSNALNDKVVLAPGAALTKVNDIQYVLEKGTVWCKVNKKEKDNFSIQTKRYIVRVVGTQFGVILKSNDEVEVVVFEGIVEVIDKQSKNLVTVTSGKVVDTEIGMVSDASKDALKEVELSLKKPLGNTDIALEGKRNLKGNESVALGEHSLMSKRVRGNLKKAAVVDSNIKESLNLWKAQIATGQCEYTEREISEFLKRNKNDAATFLLAGCYQKLGKPKHATKLYEQLAKRNQQSQRGSEALFKAAVLYQDSLSNHLRAAELLKQYIKQCKKPHLLHAAALTRLSNSYIVLGKHQLARPLLNEVIEHYSETSFAKKAQHKKKTLP